MYILFHCVNLHTIMTSSSLEAAGHGVELSSSISVAFARLSHKNTSLSRAYVSASVMCARGVPFSVQLALAATEKLAPSSPF